MESPFKELEKDKALKSVAYADLASEAGMMKKPVGYSVITKQNIFKFLKFKAQQEVDVLGIKKEIETYSQDFYKNYPFTNGNDIFIYYGGVVRKENWRTRTSIDVHIRWIETLLANYEGNPPVHILKSLVKSKNTFDEIRIVTLEKNVNERIASKYTDPLVVGINHNDTNRYLIDWWDNDIDPSEIEII